MPDAASPPARPLHDEPSTLWAALDLGAVEHPVVAIVGGGGKTALLYRLGREAEARGVHAVLGGTTRFTHEPSGRMPPLIEAAVAALPSLVADALRAAPVTLVVATGRVSQGRLAPIEVQTADRIAGLDNLGLLALEADGSKLRPFKAPGEHEPVIPSSATHVVAVVGVDALDAPLDEEHVHRPERVRAILGTQAGERCTAEAIARVLASLEGGRRGVEGRRFAVLVNKADRDPDGAARLARAIRAAGVERVVVASLRDEAAAVREVLS